MSCDGPFPAIGLRASVLPLMTSLPSLSRSVWDTLPSLPEETGLTLVSAADTGTGVGVAYLDIHEIYISSSNVVSGRVAGRLVVFLKR